MSATEGDSLAEGAENVDQPDDSGHDVHPVKRWWRAGLVVLVVFGLMAINLNFGAQAAGRALVLGVIWFVIAGFRPNATQGYSGLWLYFLGLGFVIVPQEVPGLSWGLGIIMGTLAVGIYWVGRKVWATGEGRDNWSE